MKTILTNISLFSSLIFIISCQNQTVKNIDQYPGYELVWSDEFEVDGAPNSQYWDYEKGFVRNHEDQWYQPENVWCENGMLIFETKKESKPNPNYQEGSNDWKKNRKTIEYTSSSINTRGKKAWQYGRFEMRGKIDVSAGMWPAWWTLGVSGEWPSNGEIDMMEYYRDRVLANVATGTDKQWVAKWYATETMLDELGGKAWTEQFHTWRMDWDEKEIALYVDEKLLNKVPMDSLVNRDGTGINPFKQPHYMLLNLAIGGDNGGQLDDSVFPRRYLVDYVRVYQVKK